MSLLCLQGTEPSNQHNTLKNTKRFWKQLCSSSSFVVGTLVSYEHTNTHKMEQQLAQPVKFIKFYNRTQSRNKKVLTKMQARNTQTNFILKICLVKNKNWFEFITSPELIYSCVKLSNLFKRKQVLIIIKLK